MSQPQARRDIQNRVDATLRGLFDKAVDLSIYLRACERLLREGTGFQAEGNAGEAYRTLLMYVELIVTWLPQHPQFRDKQYASRLARVSRQVVKVLAELDRLKSVVDAQYDAFTEEQGRLAAERRSQQHKARQSLAARKDRPAATTSAAAQAKGAPVDEALLQQLRNLSLPTAAYAPLSTSSAGSSSFQYPDIPVAAVDVAETAAEPRSAPAIPPKTRAPTFPEVATLENGTSLKTVFVSSRFRQTFLDIAKSNTERRLETCGILAGSCRNNAYFVTHLIIPKQESTSDTCATTDEEALFNYQDENALFTIGWIHTHPTQTCFLSSVDLHTHMAYQIMLPEAVAIVCSPSKTPSWGVFRITDPPGLQALKGCRQKGLFHPHEETHLYVDALQGAESALHVGHYREEPFDFKIVDQR